MTARELLANALALPETDRVKLAAELLASVSPGESLAAPAWESAWLSEVERREELEPDETLGAEHELPAVRERLLGLFR
jgi:hypothetical protein